MHNSRIWESQNSSQQWRMRWKLFKIKAVSWKGDRNTKTVLLQKKESSTSPSGMLKSNLGFYNPHFTHTTKCAYLPLFIRSWNMQGLSVRSGWASFIERKCAQANEDRTYVPPHINLHFSTRQQRSCHFAPPWPANLLLRKPTHSIRRTVKDLQRGKVWGTDVQGMGSRLWDIAPDSVVPCEQSL